MEPNDAEGPRKKQGSTQRLFFKIWSVVLSVCCIFWLIGSLKELSASEAASHSYWRIAVPLFLTALSVLCVFDRAFSRLINWTVGPVQYLNIDSPRIDQIIRRRYKLEIEQLRALEFEPLFIFGESFSLYRALFVFPAAMFILMLIHREVLWRKRAEALVLSYLVLVSPDKSAFAHAFGLGVKFHSCFADGTVLVTKNFKNSIPDGPRVIRQFGGASIKDSWVSHQRMIAELEKGGKTVEHQTNFEFFFLRLAEPITSCLSRGESIALR